MNADKEATLRFRPILASDHDRVGQLWVRCQLTTSYNDPHKDIEFAAGGIASDVLVGLEGDRIVASVMVGHDGHRGWLYYVAVDPDCQGRGYGAYVVAAGEAWLRDRGVAKVMLLIRETNTAVQRFYTGIGYETIPRIVMQKWLTQDA